MRKCIRCNIDIAYGHSLVFSFFPYQQAVWEGSTYNLMRIVYMCMHPLYLQART